MPFIYLYLIAYVLDLIIGDPVYRLHPIRIIGVLISRLEMALYRMNNKKLGGFILLLSTIFIVFSSCYLILYIALKINTILLIVVEIFLLYTTLATKCLGDEGMKVYYILKKGGLDFAKKELSYLVTRDTSDMSEQDIIKSTVETISENSVDGCIAPILFAFVGSLFSLGGLSLAVPIAMCYKAVNTLDSMIGYKNDKYFYFGYFSAKFDDVVNFIPSRISGGLIIPIAALILNYDYKGAVKIFVRDRKNHESPNSGHPESAFAGALGVQFGGEVSYFGEKIEKARIGDKLKNFSLEDIDKSCKLLYVSSGVTVGFIAIIYLFMTG